jgi:hypothetical protein
MNSRRVGIDQEGHLVFHSPAAYRLGGERFRWGVDGTARTDSQPYQ